MNEGLLTLAQTLASSSERSKEISMSHLDNCRRQYIEYKNINTPDVYKLKEDLKNRTRLLLAIVHKHNGINVSDEFLKKVVDDYAECDKGTRTKFIEAAGLDNYEKKRLERCEQLGVKDEPTPSLPSRSGFNADTLIGPLASRPQGVDR